MGCKSAKKSCPGLARTRRRTYFVDNMKRYHSIKRIILAVAMAGALGAPQRAVTAVSGRDLVTAELVAEVESIRPGEPFWVGIRLRMKDGWHVNWRNPGDAGLPPEVTWKLPDGFEAGDLHWPHPDRFSLPELSIFGYGGEVLLLVEITPPASLGAKKRIDISAHVDWLACREVCIPGGADLTLALAATGDKPVAASDHTELFDRAREALPVAADGWKFTAKIEDDRIVILATPPDGEKVRLERVQFFPTDQGVIENASRQELAQSGSSYKFDIERSRMNPESPSRIRGVLVSTTGWGRIAAKALTIDVPIE